MIFFRSDSKLMELQNFSQLIVDSWFNLVLISFCNLLMVDSVLGSCVLLYSRLRLCFSLGSLRLYTLGVDVSTAFMSLTHKVTAISSSSSWMVMLVSILVRLSFSVLCSKSSFVLSNR